MIYINQVMQSMKDSTRLRVIEVEEDYVYTVNIDTTSAMPKRELYANMELDIEQNELLIIGDPYVRAVPDSDLTQVQKDKRDYDWAIVEKFIIPNMSSLLRKKGREAKIVQIVADSGLTLIIGGPRYNSTILLFGIRYQQRLKCYFLHIRQILNLPLKSSC